MCDNMNNQKKLIGAIFTVMMMVFAGVVLTPDVSSAETDDTNTMNVYFYDGSQWRSGSYEVFNAFEAVQAAVQGGLGFGIETTAANSMWYVTDALNGTNPNMGYGMISGIKKTADASFTTSFVIKACNPGSSWIDVSALPLGWLRPFTDYASYAQLPVGNGVISPAYANIAIIYGTSDSVSMPSTGLRELTNPSGRADCLYNFTLFDVAGDIMAGNTACYGKQYENGNLVLKTLNRADFANGVTIYGYGSDAYLALLDATGGVSQGMLNGQARSWLLNEEPDRTYYTYYSWMDSLFGAGTVKQTTGYSTTYKYWSSYDSNFDYLDFTLGYYTTLSGYYTDPIYSGSGNASMNGNSYTLMYESMTY